MTISIAAKTRLITISFNDGSSPLDVTSVFEEFTVKDDHENGSGWCKTTGTLKLKAFPLTPLAESLNPVLNPARFAKGNLVTVYETNSSGSLVLHPRGKMRILKTPLPGRLPNRNTIEIELGCIATLLDYRTPADDKSGVTLGTADNRSTIINRLAAECGLPNLVDAITEYPINYPVPKLSGTWVQQMGTIADEAGYILYIDKNENLRAQKVNLTPSSPDLNLVVGTDEQFYDYLPSDETPCELVRCSGVLQQANTTTDPDPEVTFASDTEFSPSEIATTSFSGMNTATPTIYRQSRQPRGRVFPDLYPGSATLINAVIEQSTSYYDDDDNGLLRQKLTLTQEPLGVIYPDEYPGNPFTAIASTTYTDYVYNDDTVSSIITRKYEPAKVVYPDKDVTGTTLSYYQLEQWVKTNQGWRKTTSTRDYKNTSSGSTTSYSGSGNNQPPATERRQQEKYGEDKAIKGEVNFSSLAGSQFYERERDYEIQTPVSEDHLRYLAQQKGGLLWARINRVTWATNLRDEFLTSYKPFMTIDWTETINGVSVRSRYLTDGMSFSLVARSSVVAGDTLRLGIVSTSGLEPHYAPINTISGGFKLRGDINPIDVTPVGLLIGEMNSESSITATMTVAPPLTMTSISSITGTLTNTGGDTGLGTSLVAAYKFNGDLVDSKNGYNLTCTGTEQYNGLSDAFLFDGTTYLSKSSVSDLVMSGAFTIAITYYCLGNGILAGKYADVVTDREYMIRRYTDEGYPYLSFNIDFFGVLVGGIVETGNTYLIVASNDPSNTTDGFKLYVRNLNGDPETVATDVGATALTSTNDFRVGGYADIQIENGTEIKNIHIWKGRVLSPTDIDTLYNGGNPLEYPF